MRTSTSTNRTFLTKLYLGVSVLLCGIAAWAADTAPAVKVSDYASAEDLVAAQTYFLEQLGETLTSKEEYAEDKQERVKKNALVLAVLSMNLGLHDTANPAQAKAVALLPLATELAANAKEFDKAKAIFAKLQIAVTATPNTETSKIAWKPVRGQGAMMKKVNELNGAIKRNLTAARFPKQLDALKIQTVTLAAIGQATLLDTHEVKNPADLPAYEKYAVEFRTVAGELNKAVHASDQAAAMKAFAKMDATCQACHQKFVPPKK